MKRLVEIIESGLDGQQQLKETVITVYRGVGDTPLKPKLKYYTDNIKYAEWFKKHNALGDGRIEKEELNTNDFLDLRSMGFKFTPREFKEELNSSGIDTSEIFNWPEEAQAMLDSVYESWQIVTDDDKIWNAISKKYNGVIIQERNPEASHLGKVDSYIVYNM